MKRIAILGSTGSIGTQALDIIERNPEKYKATVLSCARRIDELSRQIEKFMPELAVTAEEKDAAVLSKRFPRLQVMWGSEGLIAAARSEYDLLLNSLMGMRGLAPTYYALKNGGVIAFANKETLVAGGQLITDIIKDGKKSGPRLIPVDSEHSAVFQCLQGEEKNEIRRILLTASGGPFRGYSREQLENVTVKQALCHPKWSMGAKITVDSATMMNKGLEVIEARWLFGVEAEKIEILVHPQSVVHSMVEFKDRTVKAQLGQPDMRLPISYAFSYPDRTENDFAPLDFLKEASPLTFEKPDRKTFGCIDAAYEALRLGGSYATAMNAANEVLVQLFLEEKIKFLDIQKYIEKILECHRPIKRLSLEEILETDRETRGKTLELVKGDIGL